MLLQPSRSQQAHSRRPSVLRAALPCPRSARLRTSRGLKLDARGVDAAAAVAESAGAFSASLSLASRSARVARGYDESRTQARCSVPKRVLQSCEPLCLRTRTHPIHFNAPCLELSRLRARRGLKLDALFRSASFSLASHSLHKRGATPSISKSMSRPLKGVWVRHALFRSASFSLAPRSHLPPCLEGRGLDLVVLIEKGLWCSYNLPDLTNLKPYLIFYFILPNLTT